MLDRWITHGLRDLPTFVYPDPSVSNKPESPKGETPVTLVTTKHQEVFSFLRPNFDGLDEDEKEIVNRLTHADLDLKAQDTYPFYRPEPPRTFDNLPHLRPSTLYVFGGQSYLSSPPFRKAKMDRTGTGVGGSGGVAQGRVKEVVFEDAGHLLPMEIVEEVADAIGGWTAGELKRWSRLEKEWKESWDAKSRQERTMVTEEWKTHIGGDPRGPGSGKL